MDIFLYFSYFLYFENTGRFAIYNVSSDFLRQWQLKLIVNILDIKGRLGRETLKFHRIYFGHVRTR